MWLGGCARTVCSDADGDWLVEHGPSVQARIETPELQRMSVMLE